MMRRMLVMAVSLVLAGSYLWADVQLDAPYINQHYDLTFSGRDSACGPTSLVMALAYWGKSEAANDEVRNAFDAGTIVKGSDHYASPELLADYARKFGLEATAYGTTTFDFIKSQLDRSSPVLLSTWLTPYGHVILAVGYRGDDTLIVNDPAGDWGQRYWNHSGKGVEYHFGDLYAGGSPKWCVSLCPSGQSPGTVPLPANSQTPTGFSVSSVTPFDGSKDVEFTSPLTVTFSKPVDSDSIRCECKPAAMVPIHYLNTSVDGKTVSVCGQLWSSKQTYAVTISTATSTSGEKMAGPYRFSFATSAWPMGVQPMNRNVALVSRGGDTVVPIEESVSDFTLTFDTDIKTREGSVFFRMDSSQAVNYGQPIVGRNGYGLVLIPYSHVGLNPGIYLVKRVNCYEQTLAFSQNGFPRRSGKTRLQLRVSGSTFTVTEGVRTILRARDSSFSKGRLVWRVYGDEKGPAEASFRLVRFERG